MKSKFFVQKMQWKHCALFKKVRHVVLCCVVLHKEEEWGCHSYLLSVQHIIGEYLRDK
jgi:hypothetical protein